MTCRGKYYYFPMYGTNMKTENFLTGEGEGFGGIEDLVMGRSCGC